MAVKVNPTLGTGAGRTPYLDALVAHASSSPTRLMVPAHKGGLHASARLVAALGERALAVDVPPQIPGIDMGPHPTPLDEAEALAADAWRAARTWFVLGGASDANRTACLALASRGTRVLVQRNVHVSTIDGLILAGLEPVFVAPEVDVELGVAHCVTPERLRAVLETAGALAGIVLVSPTYYGAAADVPALVAVGHEHDLPVVVDEAWGAHFAFHPALPVSALDAGADLVVSSTHKMLGSLTQSAMLHLGRGSRLSAATVERSLNLTRSTSPSALLGASLDAAREDAVHAGRERISRSLASLGPLHARLREHAGVELLADRAGGQVGVAAWDPFRVSVVLPEGGPDGTAVMDDLRRTANVHVELASPRVLVAILALGEEDLPGLPEALAASLASVPPRVPVPPPPVDVPFAAHPAMSPRAAFFAPAELVAAADAVGMVSADLLAIYPPGIPNVLPGEVLTPAVVQALMAAGRAGHVVRGAADPRVEQLRVVAGPAGRAQAPSRHEAAVG
jgi:arginine decarboxylase